MVNVARKRCTHDCGYSTKSSNGMIGSVGQLYARHANEGILNLSRRSESVSGVQGSSSSARKFVDAAVYRDTARLAGSVRQRRGRSPSPT